MGMRKKKKKNKSPTVSLDGLFSYSFDIVILGHDISPHNHILQNFPF